MAEDAMAYLQWSMVLKLMFFYYYIFWKNELMGQIYIPHHLDPIGTFNYGQGENS